MVNRIGGQAPLAGATGVIRSRVALTDFQKTLDEALQGPIRFSKHAAQRVQASQKDLGPEEIGKLEEAVRLASKKGCRSSLVLSKDMAYIVNVPSRTVITAVAYERMKENLFTNLDSAIIL